MTDASVLVRMEGMADGRLIAGRPYRPSWVQGLRVQSRVIGALMVRDALSRYGHDNLGFFWIVAEPLILTIGVMVLWSLTHLSHSADVGIIPFALTGYTFITLWRHIVNRSVRVLSRNAALFYHGQVKLMDLLIARALLEAIGIFAAFMVAFVPLYLLGFCPGIRDPLVLIGGFVFSAWFAFAFGMIIAGLSEMGETVEHLIQPVMYLTIPATGIFFMVDWLPPKLQELALWSPLVNGVEMFRSGLFDQDVQTHWSFTYLLTCCCIFSIVGIFLNRLSLSIAHRN